MFPSLRFGFIEASASWVPFLIHKLRRDNTKRWKPSWKSGADLFADCRFFVACEADEDLPYLTQYIGEDHLLTGSDYGHNDPAEQAQLVATMNAREDMPAGLVQKDSVRESPKILRNISDRKELCRTQHQIFSPSTRKNKREGDKEQHLAPLVSGRTARSCFGPREVFVRPLFRHQRELLESLAGQRRTLFCRRRLERSGSSRPGSCSRCSKPDGWPKPAWHDRRDGCRYRGDPRE